MASNANTTPIGAKTTSHLGNILNLKAKLKTSSSVDYNPDGGARLDHADTMPDSVGASSGKTNSNGPDPSTPQTQANNDGEYPGAGNKALDPTTSPWVPNPENNEEANNASQAFNNPLFQGGPVHPVYRQPVVRAVVSRSEGNLLSQLRGNYYSHKGCQDTQSVDSNSLFSTTESCHSQASPDAQKPSGYQAPHTVHGNGYPHNQQNKYMSGPPPPQPSFGSLIQAGAANRVVGATSSASVTNNSAASAAAGRAPEAVIALPDPFVVPSNNGNLQDGQQQCPPPQYQQGFAQVGNQIEAIQNVTHAQIVHNNVQQQPQQPQQYMTQQLQQQQNQHHQPPQHQNQYHQHHQHQQAVGPLVPYGLSQGASSNGVAPVPHPQHNQQTQMRQLQRIDVIPEHVRSQRSQLLNKLTSGPTGRPTASEALDPANFPFVESARQAANQGPHGPYGVVKLKNIPFTTRRSEIIAFLGRNSKILNDNLEPVHIIMERVTSKTNDAYVEFMTLQDAMKAVDKHNQTLSKGRLSRLGDRPIEVELSSQGALMKDLFPLATGVFWEGSYPTIQDDNPKEPWTNFKGFITDEEMTMLVKHVEVPQRSPFSRDCPQRPFECMVSTLRKMPWHMTHLITLRQRHAIYKACWELIRLLQGAIHHERSEAVLNKPLLNRLVHAAMACNGFTVVQKDAIAGMVDMEEMRRREFGMPRLASSWLHLYALSPKPNTPLDVIEYYIAIIREETNSIVNSLPLNERAVVRKQGAETDPYFGYFWWLLRLPSGEEFDSMTLAAAAMQEYTVIERLMTRAFGAI